LLWTTDQRYAANFFHKLNARLSFVIQTLAIVVLSMAFSAFRLTHIRDYDWAPIFQKSIDIKRMDKIKKKILQGLYKIK
jgi:hypothetical protein